MFACIGLTVSRLMSVILGLIYIVYQSPHGDKIAAVIPDLSIYFKEEEGRRVVGDYGEGIWVKQTQCQPHTANYVKYVNICNSMKSNLFSSRSKK